ncbi:bifunctional protein GlmU [Iodidimonas muriae]|uniref:Bifunctional protein GlmU n=1 Tax=Iodidimonas muriae TaxID=261467 RepID=A0ABQ2L851_9PROT|nr:bifunctional UDP-N-acetylglucosamine diphosphorylase/glucosamine-1-phosphate N-acetyltransferase GlmU [Iodidimonas muriae]GGO06472.1 bifunctional protein GlmU [Iodidimonas muriae]
MTSRAIAAVILAAGKGTRMKSSQHKVLHPLAGQPMIHHLLATLDHVQTSRTVMVVGAGRDQVETAMAGRDIRFAVQEPQLGTGHAVMAALPELDGHEGDILVLYGDTPLIPADILAQMLSRLHSTPPNGSGKTGLVVLGFRPKDPAQYGRLVLDDDGALDRIVEYKDATPSERAISLCNSGVMAFDGALLPDLLSRLTNSNANGEYYLTDTVAIARSLGASVQVVEALEDDLIGVNSRMDLAKAEAVIQKRMRDAAMANGATLIDPASVYFSHDTKLGRDVLVEPHVVFGPGVHIADGATIRAFSHLEGAHVAENATIGPYARLRPGAEIGIGAKVGNFVEIKKAKVEEGAKISHLSYIGDASIGAHANIGAGTITCNYDGFSKYHTSIGAGAFIGSNSALVAPVTIGAGAIIGAGSTLSGDVEADDLALTRAERQTRPGWAKKFRAAKQRKK